jgi:ABC-type branched-subunit amino acid transport system ATPase component
MCALLRVDELTVRFGGLTAVNAVSFEVEEGEFVGLIGPNGAGKTTLMDAVTGFVPSNGRVQFNGVDLSNKSPHVRIRAGIGRTFQSLELFEDLTVRENLTVAAERSSWWSPIVDLFMPRPSIAARDAVEKSLSSLGIESIANALPADLPLGQRKIVSVARSLALQPRLLLLDEPAAGLDSREGLVFGKRLRRLVEEGLTIVMIEHDMGMVLSVCDEIHVLDFGKLIASGDPDAIRGNEQVIQAYIGVDDTQESDDDAPSMAVSGEQGKNS